MQIFKLFFKVLRKYIYKVIMYLAIFCGVLFGAVIPAATKNDVAEYTNMKSPYAIWDKDNSALSNSIYDYLKGKHEEVDISDFSVENLQDELYNRNIRIAIVFEEGFEEAFVSDNNIAEYMKIYDIPNNTGCMLIKSDIQSYLEDISLYTKCGYSLAQAIEKTALNLEKSSKMEMYNGNSIGTKNQYHYFFIYLPWIFIAMVCELVAPVLIRLNREDVRKRIECSSYKFYNQNLEIGLGIAVTGIAISGIVFLISVFAVKGNMGEFIYLYTINMLIMMTIAISITFLISKLVKSDMVISLISNIVSLGMSFITGVFVPIELLGSGILKIAHFLPAYWYVKALNLIDLKSYDKLGEIFKCFGIEILFAVVIFMIGLAIANSKRVNS